MKKSYYDELELLLRRLPGIGEKSARRIAFYIVRANEKFCRQLADAILNARLRMKECRRCRNLGEGQYCEICLDPRRDRSVICIVASIYDLQAIERSGAFQGTYYVLHGTLSPLEGREPDSLEIERLKTLVENEKIKEVIIATNPSSEGEATASFISSMLRPSGVKISRIAFGVPHGGELEYADPISIEGSIKSRHEY